MRKIVAAAFTVSTLCGTQASYIVKIPLDNNIQYYKWSVTEAVFSEWTNNGSAYGCSWSPLTSTVASGKTFTQNGTNCKQDQTRLRQDREQEMTTLQTRNNGDLITEIQTLTGLTSQRTATGTYTSSSTASCKFSEANPRYYWLEYPSGVTIKVWDSKVVGNNDGYGYARAVYQRTSSDGIKYYSLCRA